MRAGVALINLCILLIVSRQMGSEVLGHISILILNIAVIQTVIEIYSGGTLIYFVPKFRISRVFLTGYIWLAVIAALSSSVLFLFHIVEGAMFWHVLFLSALFSGNAFHLVLLLGKEKIKSYNILAMIQPLVLLVFLIIYAVFGNARGFSDYLCALYYSSMTAFLFTFFRVLVVLRKDINSTNDFSFLPILSNGLINQMANLSHTLSNRLNYYLLGMAAMVGVYANATSLIESIWVISAGISPLLLTHVANERDAINQGKLSLLLAKVSFLLALAGVFCLYLLPNAVFVFLLGNDFVETKRLMLFLSPGVLCISFSGILSHYFSGKGMQRIQLSANFSGMLVTVISAWGLIKAFGIYGAAIAATLSYATQAIILTLVFFKHNGFKFSNLFSFKSDLTLLNHK